MISKNSKRDPKKDLEESRSRIIAEKERDPENRKRKKKKEKES